MKDDIKQSNPSSPFSVSASTSSANSSPSNVFHNDESLYSTASNSISQNNKNTNQSLITKSSVSALRTKRLLSGTNVTRGNAIVRHSALKRLAVASNSATGTYSVIRKNVITLQRKLLTEEINSSRAFASLCNKVLFSNMF